MTTVDRRVFELAEFFLEDEPSLRGKVMGLAQHIQMSIEEWIEAAKEDDDEEAEGGEEGEGANGP